MSAAAETSVHVDLERVKSTLIELSRIGYNDEDKGIYRIGFTTADMQARRWLMTLLEEEGFSPRMDGAGNVYGRYGPEEGPTVTLGSHLDSVPAGGMFDGALGVVAALEVLRVCKENRIELKLPIELVGTSEEEGRYGGMLGAQAISGQLTPDFLRRAHDADGVKLANAMEAAGFDPMGALDACRPPESMHAFVELHVEQGPVLERLGRRIGVVDSIAGVFKWIIHLKGKADHAGTSPMNMRSDAFMGLADFAHEIPRIIEENGTDRSRLTVGKAELKPGNPHTIPGEVMFTLVGRDSKTGVMRELADACRRVLSAIARRHKLMFEYEEVSWLEPVDCSLRIIELIEAEAEALGLDYERMPSGAGHDAQFLATITEAGMIFVPSVGGVSHAPDEWTHWHDVEVGTNLLLKSALKLSG
ncbi:MAG TPA: Zn-dependent hydrolase [Gammaproteobacteria bacterium]|nr:Zn-dependent hydrolase [Gammaproteobacteria bacterium]